MENRIDGRLDADEIAIGECIPVFQIGAELQAQLRLFAAGLQVAPLERETKARLEAFHALPDIGIVAFREAGDEGLEGELAFAETIQPAGDQRPRRGAIGRVRSERPRGRRRVQRALCVTSPSLSVRKPEPGPDVAAIDGDGAFILLNGELPVASRHRPVGRLARCAGFQRIGRRHCITVGQFGPRQCKRRCRVGVGKVLREGAAPRHDREESRQDNDANAMHVSPRIRPPARLAGRCVAIGKIARF